MDHVIWPDGKRIVLLAEVSGTRRDCSLLSAWGGRKAGLGPKGFQKSPPGAQHPARKGWFHPDLAEDAEKLLYFSMRVQKSSSIFPYFSPAASPPGFFISFSLLDRFTKFQGQSIPWDSSTRINVASSQKGATSPSVQRAAGTRHG